MARVVHTKQKNTTCQLFKVVAYRKKDFDQKVNIVITKKAFNKRIKIT